MNVLERLVRRWRLGWAAGVALTAAATGILTGVAAARTLHVRPAFPGVLVALGCAAVAVLRRRRVDALVVARHLNRALPELEESADLLIVPHDELVPLQRLQRARVERALAQLTRPPRLPQRRLALAGAYAAVALLGAGLLAEEPSIGGVRGGRRSGAPRHPVGPPRLAAVEISVRPPAYTRRPARTTRDWDLDVEEGARVTWRLRTGRPVSDLLFLTTDGDTIRGESDGDAEFATSLVPDHALLYQVLLHDGGTSVTSDYHRLGVVPDEPPTLTVTRPEPRTEVAFGAPLAVPVEVLAGDDYGVANAHLVATVTTGSGEGVKFREQILAFDVAAPRRQVNGLLLRRTLDLAALGLGPGDELYFHVVAHDNRTPRANRARSETFFVALADTSHVAVADWSGFAMTGVPEYLRSQRQIIIDTERLLADADSLTPAGVRDRSDAIGFDQHLLRERYGEIAGQETIIAGVEPTIEHEHDAEESATLLSASTKSRLQAAIGQMWEAERRLRISDPRGALSFEYRALELLKAAQAATRAYVQRIGFEPPPLEPDRTRLSGKLEKVASSSRTRTVHVPPTFPALRDALGVVQRLGAGGARRPDDAAVLERAGRELGGLAIGNPGRHLETLRMLRRLVSAMTDSSSTMCRDCLLPVERGIWRALPAPDPAASTRKAAVGLAQRYFELLRDRGPQR